MTSIYLKALAPNTATLEIRVSTNQLRKGAPTESTAANHTQYLGTAIATSKHVHPGLATGLLM